jgi:hypothetical protein
MKVDFDSHQIVKGVQKAGFNEQQAESLLEAVRAARISGIEHLATKEDLRELRADLRGEITEQGSTLRQEMAELRVDLLSQIKETEVRFIKWLIGVAIAQLAILIAVVSLI